MKKFPSNVLKGRVRDEPRQCLAWKAVCLTLILSYLHKLQEIPIRGLLGIVPQEKKQPETLAYLVCEQAHL